MAAAPGAAAASLNPLGLALFKFFSANAAGNVVISPLSVHTCLSMVAAGATEGSPTEKEMVTLLGKGPPALPPAGGPLQMAQSAWIKMAVKESYLEVVRSSFRADVRELRDTDPTPINEWVKTETHGKIEKLFEQPLDPLTVMVLVNTVFFKGSWASTFKAEATRKGEFRSFAGAQPCDMMYKKEKGMLYAEVMGAQAISLPYDDGVLSAVVLLPFKEGPEPIDALIQGFTPEAWSAAFREISDGRRAEVELRMPRFRLEFKENLTAPLKVLGMPTPFIGEEKGAFLRMSDDPGVHIDLVIHQAMVEVNEEGTVAAAATAVVMKTRCVSPPPQVMTVDRPFVFLIVDKAGNMVFAAKATEPTLSGIGATLA